MNIIDLEHADPQTEGIRAVLDLELGHITMDGDALLIASNAEALQHWLNTETKRTQPEIVEPVTVLVQEPTDEITETIPTIDDTATNEQGDDADHESDGSGGETMDDIAAPDLHEQPATRRQVLTRIKTRAGTTKTSGRRTGRRRATADRTLI